MKYRSGMPVIVLCVGLLNGIVALSLSQESPSKSKKSEPTPGEERQVEKQPTKSRSDSTITIHVKVSAEGKDELPLGSTIELKGDAETCKKLARPEQNIEPEGVTFPDLPVCRVRFWIYITGFDVKTVAVDLAKYKDPMKVLVRANGPPVVSW